MHETVSGTEKKRPRTLTHPYVTGLTEPGEYHEQELKSFFVRVSAKGTKTYFVKNSVRGGRSCVSVKIGRHEQISTREARDRAKELLYMMGQGCDPNKERQDNKEKERVQAEQERKDLEADKVTLADVLSKYIEVRIPKYSRWAVVEESFVGGTEGGKPV
jgi:Arm DNA-binding domain